MKSLWAITGSSGFIGRALTARLTAENIAWRGLDADIRDEDALSKFVLGADVVVHLAGYVHRSTRSEADRRDCWSINVGGTKALVNAVSQQNPSAFVLLMSSASVYRQSEEAATESFLVEPQTPYGESKAEAERILMNAVRSGRCNGAVLRPAMVFGPGAPGNLARLIRMVRFGIVVEIARGCQRKSLVPVDALVDAVLAVVNCGTRVNGEIFNVAGGSPATIDEIVRTVARALRKSPLTVSLPRPFIRVLPGALGTLAMTYASSTVLEDEKLRQTTGLQFHVGPLEALREMVRDSVEE